MRFQPVFVPCDMPSHTIAVRSTRIIPCNACPIEDRSYHLMTHTYYICHCSGKHCQIKYSKKQCREHPEIFRWAVSPGEHAVLPEGEALPTPKLSKEVKRYIGDHMDIHSPVHIHADLLAAGNICKLKQVQNCIFKERKKRKIWIDYLTECKHAA